MNLRLSAMTVLVLVNCSPASAGVYADSLAKCLVDKTSDTDKYAFVRWIFSGLSASDSVKDLAAISAKERDEINTNTAHLFDRLILIDCRGQAVDAIKYEGPSSFETGFGVLGQVATRSLLSDPIVNENMTGFTKFLNKTEWDALTKPTGTQPQPPATK